MPSTKEIITSYLSAGLHKRLSSFDNEFFDQISEIRIRADKPLFLYRQGKEYDAAYRPTQTDINETLEKISQYSLYAFEEELRMGYITLPGGHRVGITGKTTVERQTIRTVHHVSGLNIRVAHQIKGCADSVLPLLLHEASRPLYHTMVISPPGCGKTTLLRDIVRQISNGIYHLCRGMTVGVVDERSEIAGCYKGVAQNDVGIRTDVLDSCPKAEGMVMLLRAMSPEVIAVDELGGERDVRAVEDVLNAGVKLICTAHGRDLADIRQNPMLRGLLDKRIFERFIILYTPGAVEGVYDADGNPAEGNFAGGTNLCCLN